MRRTMHDMRGYARRARRRATGAAGRMIVLASALTLTMPAAAQQAAPTVLRVTVDHASVLTLAAAPGVVVIADPKIADIINERDHLIFVLGKRPGATNLLAFDGAGHRLLDREIVVVPENADTVTVTRATIQTEYSCAPRCAFRDQAPIAGTAPSDIGANFASAGPSASGGATPAFTPPPSAPSQ